MRHRKHWATYRRHSLASDRHYVAHRVDCPPELWSIQRRHVAIGAKIFEFTTSAWTKFDDSRTSGGRSCGT